MIGVVGERFKEEKRADVFSLADLGDALNLTFGFDPSGEYKKAILEFGGEAAAAQIVLSPGPLSLIGVAYLMTHQQRVGRRVLCPYSGERRLGGLEDYEGIFESITSQDIGFFSVSVVGEARFPNSIFGKKGVWKRFLAALRDRDVGLGQYTLRPNPQTHHYYLKKKVEPSKGRGGLVCAISSVYWAQANACRVAPSVGSIMEKMFR